MKKLNKKGFTIIELVIVIAVIAILAGVLVPTFTGIVNKANESAALQQASTVNTAARAYADNGNTEGYYIVVNQSGKDYYFIVEDGNVVAKDAAVSASLIYASLDTLKTDVEDDEKTDITETTTVYVLLENYNTDAASDSEVASVYAAVTYDDWKDK